MDSHPDTPDARRNPRVSATFRRTCNSKSRFGPYPTRKQFPQASSSHEAGDQTLFTCTCSGLLMLRQRFATLRERHSSTLSIHWIAPSTNWDKVLLNV